MHPSATNHPCKYHRLPADIISHGVWLYYRFYLSYRDVEELLCARGVIVTYEVIRQWGLQFRQACANQLRRRPQPGDTWHLDEVFLTINGERYYLWRAVEQDGNILDILVQRRRHKQAAKTFFRKLLKGLTYVPRVIITDPLQSSGAAKQEMLPGVEPRQRERCLPCLTSPGHALRFLAASGPSASHLRPRRHWLSAPTYRQEMSQQFQIWHEITGTAAA